MPQLYTYLTVQLLVAIARTARGIHAPAIAAASYHYHTKSSLTLQLYIIHILRWDLIQFGQKGIKFLLPQQLDCNHMYIM